MCVCLPFSNSFLMLILTLLAFHSCGFHYIFLLSFSSFISLYSFLLSVLFSSPIFIFILISFNFFLRHQFSLSPTPFSFSDFHLYTDLLRVFMCFIFLYFVLCLQFSSAFFDLVYFLYSFICLSIYFQLPCLLFHSSYFLVSFSDYHLYSNFLPFWFSRFFNSYFPPSSILPSDFFFLPFSSCYFFLFILL